MRKSSLAFPRINKEVFTMTAKKLFCILLSASALLAASCTFVKTTENEKEEKETVEVKEDETEKKE